MEVNTTSPFQVEAILAPVPSVSPLVRSFVLGAAGSVAWWLIYRNLAAFATWFTYHFLPEAIILRKVLKPRLIATFFGIVAMGIMLVGYLFNFLM